MLNVKVDQKRFGATIRPAKLICISEHNIFHFNGKTSIHRTLAKIIGENFN
jgi:hypothetical protein